MDEKQSAFNVMFTSAELVPPKLTDAMWDDLDVDLLHTSHFGDGTDKWLPGASYGLEFGMADATLEKYWETPRRWNAFEYFERSNGYTTSCGLIASSEVMFINQQCAADQLNHCMNAYNEFIFPIFEVTPTIPGVIVVMSTYRDDAYILSAESGTWDEYAPMTRVLGPIPPYMGIVGVWRGYDENRYTPRSLDDIAAMRNPMVSAAGKYLKECLRLFPSRGE